MPLEKNLIIDRAMTSPGPTGLKVHAGLRVASLGSGSAGNSTVICSSNTTLLLDCGFTLKESVARLSALGLTLDDLDAILISHEHSDHVRGLGPIARKCNASVWITHGSYDAWRDKKIANVNFCTAHQPFTVGDISIDPFPTPHDAAESCQFVFSVGDSSATRPAVRFVVLTDLGICTSHIMEKLKTANAILIECNYDLEMLRNGPYPVSLQSRIRSRFGHLGNQQSAELLAQIDHPELHRILLGHLSERNNTPQLAHDTVAACINNAERVRVLEQHKASEWFEIAAPLISAGDDTATTQLADDAKPKPEIAVEQKAEEAGKPEKAQADPEDSSLSIIA